MCRNLVMIVLSQPKHSKRYNGKLRQQKQCQLCGSKVRCSCSKRKTGRIRSDAKRVELACWTPSQLSNKILHVQSAEKNEKVDKEELDETTLKFWGEPNEKSEDISVIKMLKLLSMRKWKIFQLQYCTWSSKQCCNWKILTFARKYNAFTIKKITFRK